MKIAIFTKHFYLENFHINYIVQQLKKNQIFIFISKPHYNLENKYTIFKKTLALVGIFKCCIKYSKYE